MINKLDNVTLSLGEELDSIMVSKIMRSYLCFRTWQLKKKWYRLVVFAN